MPNPFFDFRQKYAGQHPELKGKPIELSKAAGKAYRAQKKGGMRGGACDEGDTDCSAFSLLKGGRRRRGGSRKHRKGGMRGGGAEDGPDDPTPMEPEAEPEEMPEPDSNDADETTDAAPEPEEMPEADAAPELPKVEDLVGGRRRRSRKHRKHAKKSGKKSAKKHHKKSKSKKHHKKSAKRRSKKAGRR